MTPETLLDELYDRLSNTFEDNLAIVYRKYASDEVLDDNTCEEIARRYMEAKDAYIEALASIIVYPDSIEYIDE